MAFRAKASAGPWVAVISLFLTVSSLGHPAYAAAQAGDLVSPPAASTTSPVLKRRIAIGRFSNATNYGRALLLPGETDPLADQAADMLAARLVESGEFIVLERRNLDAVTGEQKALGGGTPVGADTVLIGSVTQFGRRAEGNEKFLSQKAQQVASATVEIRLVNAKTGQAFFSTSGSGTATVETRGVMGFGSRAAYDSTLNDRAISAAVSDLMSNVINKLRQQDWSTDILSVAGDEIMISGGAGQGLRLDQRLYVSRKGQTIVSKQTGLPIELPPTPVATIRIIGFFGSGDAEGSRAQLVSGKINPSDSDLVVTEATP